MLGRCRVTHKAGSDGNQVGGEENKYRWDQAGCACREEMALAWLGSITTTLEPHGCVVAATGAVAL